MVKRTGVAVSNQSKWRHNHAGRREASCPPCRTAMNRRARARTRTQQHPASGGARHMQSSLATATLRRRWARRAAVSRYSEVRCRLGMSDRRDAGPAVRDRSRRARFPPDPSSEDQAAGDVRRSMRGTQVRQLARSHTAGRGDGMSRGRACQQGRDRGGARGPTGASPRSLSCGG